MKGKKPNHGRGTALAAEGLVARTFGGRNGGKAWPTPAGEAAISQFWEMAGKFREWQKDQEA